MGFGSTPGYSCDLNLFAQLKERRRPKTVHIVRLHLLIEGVPLRALEAVFIEDCGQGGDRSSDLLERSTEWSLDVGFDQGRQIFKRSRSDPIYRCQDLIGDVFAALLERRQQPRSDRLIDSGAQRTPVIDVLLLIRALILWFRGWWITHNNSRNSPSFWSNDPQAIGMFPRRIEPGPGQESVWDFPRPPRLERTDARIVVRAGEHLLADTTGASRVLETSQAPAFYLPRHDVNTDLLKPSVARSYCEWKGEARYFDFAGPDQSIDRVAWTYDRPTEAFTKIAGHLAFYAQKLTCSVDGEEVDPNEGTFYGGWVTSSVVGPFKGIDGSTFW